MRDSLYKYCVGRSDNNVKTKLVNVLLQNKVVILLNDSD